MLALDADRAKFFGALDACHEHGVGAKVHRQYADSVLVSSDAVDLQPWDPQDHLFKRAFDLAFAAGGLIAFAPVMAVIAVAIKLDSEGPYSTSRSGRRCSASRSRYTSSGRWSRTRRPKRGRN